MKITLMGFILNHERSKNASLTGSCSKSWISSLSWYHSVSTNRVEAMIDKSYNNAKWGTYSISINKRY